MFCLTQFCRICIRNDDNLINIYNKIDSSIDNVNNLYDILKCINPEFVTEETSLFNFMCEKCCGNLKNSYDFFQKCFKSEMVLREYYRRLNNVYEKSGRLNQLIDKNFEGVKTNNINNDDDNILEKTDGIEIKVEPYDTKTFIGNEDEDQRYVSKDASDESEYPSEFNKKDMSIIKRRMNYDDCKKFHMTDSEKHNKERSKECNDDKSNDYVPDSNKNYLEPCDSSEDVSKNICDDEIVRTDLLPKPFKTVTGLEIIKISPPPENTILRAALERLTGDDEIKIPHIDLPVRGPDKTYECPYCQKKFSQMCHVKNHILIHTGLKPFECKICRKRFNQSSVLKRHLTVHTGLKPHQCQLCLRTFSHTGNLKKHLLTHNTEQPQWECNVCHKKFNLECYLKKHMHTHDDLKKFKCDKCEKRFRESGNLKAHMTSHSNLKPYKCEHCPKAFKHSVSLVAHRNNHTIIIKQ